MRGLITGSIHRKFIGVMTATLLVVNIPILAVYTMMMTSSLEHEHDIKNRAILNANAASLSKPLWDFDYKILPRWADVLLLEESIEVVKIFDDKNEVILFRGEEKQQNEHVGHAHHSVHTQDIVHISDGKPIKVGSLEIHYDSIGVAQSVWWVVSKSIMLLSISIAAILVTALFANRYLIARPLSALTNAIDATYATGKIHLVEVTSTDEIANVSSKFNEMQELLEAERGRIKQAFELLNEMHNRTPALLYTLDQQGRIKAVSDFWLLATGYFEEEVLGRPFTDFVTENSMESYKLKKSHLELQPGQLAEATCIFRKRNGDPMHVLIRESVDQDSLTYEIHSVAVMTDITSLKTAEETLRLQAETDSLTGLLNRSGVTSAINTCLSEANGDDDKVALIFMDLDRFKWVNDNLGHSAGDKLLTSVAHNLNELVGEGEYVGRFGGDEFAVLVSGEGAEERVIELSKQIMRALEEPTNLHGRDFSVAVSIGVSVFPDHASDAVELIQAADVAMYHRKKCGRNGFTMFDHELGVHAGKFLETEQLINQALKNDWFELHLQPIIDLSEDRIVGLEALLRLNHPEYGLMPPSEIIETAEKSTKILDIGDRVIDLAMQHLVDFENLPLLKDCYLTVNFSAAQFLPGLPAKIAAKLMQNNICPDKLVLEITETVLMQETENLSGIFDAIRDLGCRFALDDFGTGYSSLNYLNKFPVSIVKIDRSFVQMMEQEAETANGEAKAHTLVQSVIAMSQQLGLKVVAEGIETREDSERLITMGADMGQGYYFSRPVPISVFQVDALETDLVENVG